ncbi:hypothetical protein Golomagni_08233 [Golovinomyces magnicellulatus]|nr:hypothetical protein Golomagni_08233 [Golovinomyces magnicellulatus]
MESASLGMVTNRRATLGIWLAAEYQGHDYGEEACNWILDWGFSQVGLHAIDLEVFSNNTHAIEVYKSLGFVQEGRKREAIYFNRKCILEDEWEALRDKTVYTMDD